jgi:hypothetical protein
MAYRKGAENIPLQYINKSMPILVIVYDLRNDDAVVEEKRIDYGNIEERKWLGRISFWAFQNHCSVETIALVDAEAEIKGK